MRSNYEERKAARIEAYQNLAAKNGSLSSSLWERSGSMLSVIPMGQPILVGHHSERGHRNLLAKADNMMRKSVETQKKADYYADRAASAASNRAISSDDPNSIEKLQEKLAGLERSQELMKAINKILKKKIADIEKVAGIVALGMKESTALQLLVPVYGRVGVPSYKLTNNSANIRTVKLRIEQLSKVAAIETTETEINGVRMVINAEDNRVQLFFPGKPTEDVRTNLKRNGFRWAPSVGAWMRQISNGAIWAAKDILSKVN